MINFKASEQSISFLKQKTPEVLDAPNYKEALILLFIWIIDNGFAPPKYWDYNDLGREAQKVYDDIYFLNKQMEEAEAE